MPTPITRRTFAGLLIPAWAYALAREGDGLDARVAGGRIHVSAPGLRFLTGKALERLQQGAPAPFAFQLSVSTDHWATVCQRDIQRFVLSYDLWEERFAVVKAGAARKSASHLTARAAEAWCVEEVSLAPAGLADKQPCWLRLDVRSETPAEEAQLEAQDPMSLTRLIDLFSRKSRGEQARWTLDAGPLVLASLRRAPERGSGR